MRRTCVNRPTFMVVCVPVFETTDVRRRDFEALIELIDAEDDNGSNELMDFTPDDLTEAVEMYWSLDNRTDVDMICPEGKMRYYIVGGSIKCCWSDGPAKSLQWFESCRRMWDMACSFAAEDEAFYEKQLQEQYEAERA